MMDDYLLSELKYHAEIYKDGGIIDITHENLFQMAADEIEKLRGELERLRRGRDETHGWHLK
jgi:hypothetical protein